MRKSCQQFLDKFNCNRNKCQSERTFYCYFKPIAYISRQLGVLPLSNLSDCYSLKFGYFSFPLIYSTVLFVCAIGSVFAYNLNHIRIVMQSKEKSLQWISFLVAIIFVRSFVCCYFCASRSRKFIKLIQTLDLFDMKRNRYFQDDTSRNYVTSTIRPIIIGASLTISFSASLWNFSRISTAQTGSFVPTNIGLVIFGLLGIWQVVPLFLYNYFAMAISDNLKHINKIISEMIPLKKWCLQKQQTAPNSNTKDVLRNIRVLHLLISDAVQHLSNSYGSFLAVDQCYVIVIYVTNIYALFFIEFDDRFSLMACAIIDGLLVLRMIYVSHQVTSRVSVIFLIVLRDNRILLDKTFCASLVDPF